MIIDYTKQCIKDLKKLKKSDQIIFQTTKEKIKLFTQNPKHPSLRVHKLAGTMKEKYSISVKSNLRIIFSWVDNDRVIFFRIGTHNEVYESN